MIFVVLRDHHRSAVIIAFWLIIAVLRDDCRSQRCLSFWLDDCTFNGPDHKNDHDRRERS